MGTNPTSIRLKKETIELNEQEASEVGIPTRTYMGLKLAQEAPWKRLKEKQKRLALDALRSSLIRRK